MSVRELIKDWLKAKLARKKKVYREYSQYTCNLQELELLINELAKAVSK